MTPIIRNIKRLFVFLPAGLVLFLVINDIYPTFNDYLPTAPALIFSYLIAAYFLIPTFIRSYRILRPPSHVPYYSTTPDGFASDPINIGIFGTKKQLINAMTGIGWHKADPRNIKTILRMIHSVVFSKLYANAPFSHLYLLGRSQDIGFQLSVDKNPRHRHHVRFWAVHHEVAENFKEDVDFWHRHHPRNGNDDRFLWLGAASQDIGIGMIRHNAQLSHTVHPDTNAEREIIVKALRRTKLVKQTKTIKISTPYRIKNRVIRGQLYSDGKLTVCVL